MSNSGEFTGRELVAGTLRGIRSFKVDEFGRLLPATHNGHIWTPGENVAKCLCSGLKAIDRTPAALTHTCGFYSYFDSVSNSYHTTEQIEGVVDCSGTITVGSRGLRAEKATIIALVDPRPKPETRPWFKRIRWTAPAVIRLLFFSVALIICVIALLNTRNRTSLLFVIGYAVVIILNSFMGPFLHPKSELPDPAENSRWARVLANYPDVEIFSSLKEALVKFPLTTPPPPPSPVIPSPATHADFWTARKPGVVAKRTLPDITITGSSAIISSPYASGITSEWHTTDSDVYIPPDDDTDF